MIRAEVEINDSEVRSLVTKHYGLEVLSVQKVRAIYKVETSHGIFGFKNAEELPDLPFIANCLHTIRLNGFERTPRFLAARNGEYMIHYDKKTYFMEEWMLMDEIPKESFPFLGHIGNALARFHRASRGIIPHPASHRFDWGKRKPFLSNALKKIELWQQQGLTSNSAIERRILDFLHYRCLLASEYVKHISPDQLFTICPESAVLCHGGLHHKNILIDRQNRIWFIDFETMSYTDRVMDLAQLLQYHATPYQWNLSVVYTFLKAYTSQITASIRPEEWNIFLSYLAFPRRFANRMVRYFDDSERPMPFLLKLEETVTQETGKELFFSRFNPNVM